MKSFKTEFFDRHSHFPLHVATFVLILLSFLTAKRIIPDSTLILLTGGTFIGFCTSWYIADSEKAQNWITLVVNILGLTIVIWLIGTLLYTEFLYLSIIKVLFKALLAIELVLSFILFSSKSYNYIQISSIFLILGSIAIKTTFSYQQLTIIILYIFTYVIIMRLRFLIEIKRNIKSFIGTKVRNIRNIISIVILVLVFLGSSWVLFIRLSKVTPYPYGILPSKFIGPAPEKEVWVGQVASSIKIQQNAEQRFSASRERLNRELNGLVDRKQTTTYQKKKLLYFLLELLRKDTSIQEIQEEILKLKDFLTSAELDLSLAKRNQLMSLADEYMHYRTEYELEQLNKALKEKLSVTQLNMGQRLAILLLFKRTQNTNEFSLAHRIVKKAYEQIEKEQLLILAQKEDLKDVFNGLLSAKTNQTIMYIIGSLKERIKRMNGLNEKERKKLNETLLDIETDREISLLKEHFKEIEKELKKIKMHGKISQNENNRVSRKLDTLRRVKNFQIASNITFHIVKKTDSLFQEPEAKRFKDELGKIKQARHAEEFQKSFSKIRNILEQFRKQGTITSLDSNYIEILLERLRQAKIEEFIQQQENELATTLTEETRLTSLQTERLKDELAQLKEATTKQQARESLEKITEELVKLREEGRLDYVSSKMLKQKTEEIYQIKFSEEVVLEQLTPDEAKESQRLEKKFTATKDPFSSFSDKIKKLNISSISKENLVTLIKQLQKSSNPIHVRQTMKDINNQLESLKELKEISTLENETLKKRVKILARIKEEMVKASLLLPLIKEIEGLKNISREQKEELKDNMEQMVSKNDFEGLEKKYNEIINKINEIKLQKQNIKFGFEIKKDKDEKDEELKRDWKIEILPSTIFCYAGEPFQLKAIGIYKNSIIHDLTEEVIWKSENKDIVYIYKGGKSLPLAAGKAKIKAVWLDDITSEAECIVIQKIPDEKVQWLNEVVSKEIK